MPGKARRILSIFILIPLVSACQSDKPEESSSCIDRSLEVITESSGIGRVFTPDPISDSGNTKLSPTSLDLNQFASQVGLMHLGGRGVLEGQYVDVRNGLSCNEGFGAFSPNNEFVYSHADAGFQETMAYHYGDSYRAFLDSQGKLRPVNPIKIIAHCMLDDNAYFVRGVGVLFRTHGKTVGRATGLGVLFLIMGAAPVSANPTLARLVRALKTPVGNAVLRTRQGQVLLKTFRIGHYERLIRTYQLNRGDFKAIGKLLGQSEAEMDLISREFAKILSAPENIALRKEFESQLKRINRHIKDYRKTQGLEETLMKLSPRERLLVRIMARRFVSLERPGGLIREIGSNRIRFTTSARGSGYGRTKRFFRNGEPKSLLDKLPPPTRNPGLIKRSWGKVRNFFGEINQCLKNQDLSSEKKGYLSYLLTSIGITQTVGITGYVIATGVKNINMVELGTDVLIRLFGTFAGTRIMRGNLTFKMRWLRVAAFGAGMSTFDAVFYHLDPVGRAYAIPPTSYTPHTYDETLSRYKFNLVWAEGTSVKSAFLYHFVTGLMCLYPGARWVTWGTTALRFGEAIGNSYIYFTLRNKLVTHRENESPNQPIMVPH